MAGLQVLLAVCLLGFVICQEESLAEPAEVDDIVVPEQSDPCLSGPCMNGGSCFVKFGYYRCSCPNGFVGLNCEKAKDTHVQALENRVAALEDMVHNIIRSGIRRLEWSVDSFKKNVNQKLNNFFDILREYDSESDGELDFNWDELAWDIDNDDENDTNAFEMDSDGDGDFDSDDLVRTWDAMQSHFRSRLRNVGDHVRRLMHGPGSRFGHRRHRTRGRHAPLENARNFWRSRNNANSQESQDDDEINVEMDPDDNNEGRIRIESERRRPSRLGTGWRRTASTRRGFRNHTEDASRESEERQSVHVTQQRRTWPRDGKARVWGKSVEMDKNGHIGLRPRVMRPDGEKPSI